MPTITETKISTSGHVDNPAIYNNRIVWIDIDYAELETYYDVYMYDLSTKKETQITTSGHAGENPAIYGDRIVYSDHYEGSEIYMYDLSTKKRTQITTSGNAEDPAIYNNRIVWRGNYDIYMYDLSTKKETQITSEESIQTNPSIYGDRIVWNDDRNGNWDIYMYNVSTKKETQITNGSSWAIDPAIYGDRIVWMDERSGNYDIYMYDLSTKKETQITSSPDAQTHPAIYGNRIVWEDDGGEDDDYTNHGIYMYDISTNQKMKISNKGSARNPAIYSNNVVWKYVADIYGNGDIYMGTISSGEPVASIAAFSAKPTSGKAPLTVAFKDESTGTPTKWIWNFGDGSKSFLQNPVHKYSKAGTYTVSLTVKNAAGRNTITKTDCITVAAKPVAAFSASPTSGKVPLKVQFTDTSTGTPTKWIWNFGDGSKSFHQNPVHKYSKAGTYTVSLTVKNAAGRNSITKTKYITVTVKPVAAFSASPTSGKYPLNVKFTDKSTGSPTKWKWDFGDGTKSFLQNPTHKYSKAGKYTVTLKVTNAAGINTATKSNYITVTGTAQAPTADFWGWPLSGKAPLKVTFTETSKGSPTSWKWDFGDGKYSTEKSPTHTYSSAGTYTVKLIATNEAGSSTKSKWKYIKVAK
ncbi:Chitin binding protein [Methanosarcina barkeri str. Wiesmoor]|uniref:Chitin binding protein n=1 Tax=Methanosarcina barkeri str. Wiesmoor TaxID=1434109 RepID=A0A0E3QN03_METBA|nr:Chitin binding protein [Methanosarcina barkeri str. Wiesmoor]